MRYLLTILLAFTTALTFGQTFPIAQALKSPPASGNVTLGRKSDGYWYEKSKLGPEKKIRIDTSQIDKLGSQFVLIGNQINQRTAYQSLSSLRGVNLSAAAAPGVIQLTDAYRSGAYRLNPANTSGADNGGTVLVTGSGLRYELLHNGEVSITQFGAIPSDGIDDTYALQQAAMSGVALLAPEGLYEVSSSIYVINTGNFRLRGLGVGAQFRMNADTDLFVFVSNNGGGGYMDFDNLFLIAGVNMTDGAAIRIRGGTTQRVATLSRLTISRFSPGEEWKYGIWCENPSGLTISNSELRGNGPVKFVAIAWRSTQVAIAPIIDHVQVYDAYRGLESISNSAPGIEGAKVMNSDFVGCGISAWVESTYSTASYVPPGFQFSTCHFNSYSAGIVFKNYVQVSVDNSILYGNGSGDNSGINLENVSQGSITHNKLFRVGAGAYYGVMANAGNNTNLQINFNQIQARAEGTEPAIWIGSTTANSQVLYNITTGLSGLGGNGLYNQSSSTTDVGNVRNNY